MRCTMVAGSVSGVSGIHTLEQVVARRPVVRRSRLRRGPWTLSNAAIAAWQSQGSIRFSGGLPARLWGRTVGPPCTVRRSGGWR